MTRIINYLLIASTVATVVLAITAVYFVYKTVTKPEKQSEIRIVFPNSFRILNDNHDNSREGD